MAETKSKNSKKTEEAEDIKPISRSNTLERVLPIPPLETGSNKDVFDWLVAIFQYFSPSSTHQECEELAGKFPTEADGGAMYMAKESDWQKLYGDIVGRRLYELVQSIKYGYASYPSFPIWYYNITQ